MKHRAIGLVLALILILPLGGCDRLTARKFACADFARVQSLRGRSGARGELIASIATSYGLDPGQVTAGTASDTHWMLSWQRYGATYKAFGVADAIDDISVRLEHAVTSLQDVIDCLGPPALYYARLYIPETGLLTIYLVYPDKGLFVSGARTVWSRFDTGLRIKGSLGMYDMRIVQPGTAIAVLSQVYGSDPAREDFSRFKPWPATLEEIEVTEEKGSD